jgi:predicted dienelactone hydrolase
VTPKVVFAAGRGGDPERHAPLLSALRERGCGVIAPRFERLAPVIPTADDLVQRARVLGEALRAIGDRAQPVIGIGHSLGGTMLLAFAGAQLWTREGEPVAIARDDRLKRLVLMAPPTGFFQAPHALDTMGASLCVYAGTKDDITPVQHAQFLRDALGGERVDLRIVEGAGHFSFMSTPPPGTVEPLADREAFLARLTHEVCELVLT